MQLYGLFFLAGIVIGTVVLNIVLDLNGNILLETIEAYHSHMKSLFEPSINLWIRVCLYRLSMAVLILCCIRWTESFDILYWIIWIGGMSFGYTLSLLSYCYGLKGIMCMMVYLLPHGFIYVPLILMILKGTSTKIYDDYYLNYKIILLVFIIIGAGCGLETYMNPIFLKFFLKKFL